MNRRRMMKGFPALAAAATALAHAMPAEAHAATQHTLKAPPAYEGRLRPAWSCSPIVRSSGLGR